MNHIRVRITNAKTYFDEIFSILSKSNDIPELSDEGYVKSLYKRAINAGLQEDATCQNGEVVRMTSANDARIKTDEDMTLYLDVDVDKDSSLYEYFILLTSAGNDSLKYARFAALFKVTDCIFTQAVVDHYGGNDLSELVSDLNDEAPELGNVFFLSAVPMMTYKWMPILWGRIEDRYQKHPISFNIKASMFNPE